MAHLGYPDLLQADLKLLLRKGASAFIEGRLQTRSWEQEGQKKYRTEIVADRVQFGPRVGGGGAPQSAAPAQAAPADESPAIEYPEEDINPEDIPF